MYIFIVFITHTSFTIRQSDEEERRFTKYCKIAACCNRSRSQHYYFPSARGINFIVGQLGGISPFCRPCNKTIQKEGKREVEMGKYSYFFSVSTWRKTPNKIDISTIAIQIEAKILERFVQRRNISLIRLGLSSVECIKWVKQI